MTRSMFYATGAVIGSITGPTTVSFWPDDPQKFGWGQGSLVPIDLGKNVSAVRAGKLGVADIAVDDYVGYGGATGIGPMYPGGVMTGMCWLSSQQWAVLAGKGLPLSRIPAGAPCRDYEMTSVLYWNGTTPDRRYYGMYAAIVPGTADLKNHTAMVTIWQPGTSQIAGQLPLGTYLLDFTPGQWVHPVEKGLTEIGIEPGQPQTGGLFLDWSARKVVPYDPPKNPTFSGAGTKEHRSDRRARR